MKIGFSTGFTELYWGTWFQDGRQLGGTETVVKEIACGIAARGHEVTVRLPYKTEPFVLNGVRWIGLDAPSQRYEALFLCDDFAPRDSGETTCLIAMRSDPPPHSDFDEMFFLSAHHARAMGHPGRPHIGAGVHLSDYATPLPRLPRRVLCTVSPDRAPMARMIGEACGDFLHTYKPVPGFKTVELPRPELIRQQLQAQVFIYPYDPTRESDFFSMAILEAMAAGTPCVIADGESHVELWGDAAIVIPRPTDLSTWYERVTEVMENPAKWRKYSRLGRLKAQGYDWTDIASLYLAAVGAVGVK